jgi:hypothetical protein
MVKGKKTIVLALLYILILAFPVYATWAASAAGQNLYLPIINKAKIPTSTVGTVYPTVIVPTNTTQPPPRSGNVVITNIFYHGLGQNEPDEYVEIRNADTYSIQLANWTLRDNANHFFTFPSFVIHPSQICRVYTNEDHPEYCGFNFHSEVAIWNNTGGDCAYLRDSTDLLIDLYCYE